MPDDGQASSSTWPWASAIIGMLASIQLLCPVHSQQQRQQQQKPAARTRDCRSSHLVRLRSALLEEAHEVLRLLAQLLQSRLWAQQQGALHALRVAPVDVIAYRVVSGLRRGCGRAGAGRQ